MGQGQGCWTCCWEDNSPITEPLSCIPLSMSCMVSIYPEIGGNPTMGKLKKKKSLFSVLFYWNFTGSQSPFQELRAPPATSFIAIVYSTRATNTMCGHRVDSNVHTPDDTRSFRVGIPKPLQWKYRSIFLFHEVIVSF